MKSKEAKHLQKVISAAIDEALSHRAGELPSKETLERVLSDLAGMPCKLPDYNPLTGEASTVVVYPIYSTHFIQTCITVDTSMPDSKPVLADWQVRVIDERKELTSKIDKLLAFLNGQASIGLDEEDRNLLEEQYACMVAYQNVLNQRIDRFWLLAKK